MFHYYAGLLKMFQEFRDNGKEVELSYVLYEGLDDLKAKYNLETIAGTETDFSKAVRLLRWMSEHCVHFGNFTGQIRLTAMDILDYSFDKGTDYGVNCRILSIALTECLLSIGMKARTVYMMPASPYDFDNHVVCETWCEELGKWVMLDPTYALYFMDESGIPLNLVELREKIADRKKLALCDGAHYNGEPLEYDQILSYYAKDLFYFQMNKTQGHDFGNIENNWFISFVPTGYDVIKRTVAGIDYRIAEWGSNENLLTWRKNAEEDCPNYQNISLLK